MPLEPLICRSRYGTLRKVIRIRENLENQKNHIPLQCSKKTRVLTVPRGTIKTKDYEC